MNFFTKVIDKRFFFNYNCTRFYKKLFDGGNSYEF